MESQYLNTYCVISYKFKETCQSNIQISKALFGKPLKRVKGVAAYYT